MKILEMKIKSHPAETESHPYGDGSVTERTGKSWSGTATIKPSPKGIDLSDLIGYMEKDDLLDAVYDLVGEELFSDVDVDISIEDITVQISFQIQ